MLFRFEAEEIEGKRGSIEKIKDGMIVSFIKSSSIKAESHEHAIGDDMGDETSLKRVLESTNQRDQDIQTDGIHIRTTEVQVDPQMTMDAGISTTNFVQGKKIVEGEIESMVSAIMTTNKSLLDVSKGFNGPHIRGPKLNLHRAKVKLSFNEISLQKVKQRFYASKSTLQTLSLLEMAVQQNTFAAQQAKYRGVPLAPATKIPFKQSTEEVKANLDLLFNFQSPMTSRCTVTCMVWNKVNKDVLAVGYAGCGHDSDKVGYVMLWSLRNPSHPEKYIRTRSAVTAIGFSKQTPTVLAVGMEDGCVYLLDTSHQDCAFLNIDTASISGRHMTTITELTWIQDKQQTSTERLVSLSTDGRVLQWSIKKGMCLQPLLTLKRCTVDTFSSKLPNIAMGLCLDFPQKDDSMIYVVGSEDGTLSHCSRSYSEKHLSHIKGHMGPITQVACSPHDIDTFLTSSADSTVKVWNVTNKRHEMKEKLIIHPTNLLAPINDIAWSPCIGTLFALVAADGRIEVWDISISKLDPIADISSTSQIMSGNERTCILFGNCGTLIIVGNEQGVVEVYKLNQEKP